MRSLSIWSLLALLAVVHLSAQTKTEVMYDNEHMRVVKTTLGPQQSAPLEEDKRNRVQICLDGGEMTQTAQDGKVEKIALKAGEVRWAPAAGPAVRKNVGGKPFQIVEIEVKGKAQPPVVLTDLDPLKVDSKHYKLELENDHVRVVRVNFGPLEKGMVHTHLRNYVVVYMTPQTKGNRGDINPHMNEGAVTHTESNALDRAVERIAVELK